MLAAFLLFSVFHFAQSRFCELYVYRDFNRQGSSWGGIDINQCWGTPSFENDVVSSAWLKSHDAFSCTATFYDSCGCGFGPSEMLMVSPYSESTINFGGTVNDKVSCIRLTAGTPKPTTTTTTAQPTQQTNMPTQTTLAPTMQTAIPSVNPSINPTVDPTINPTNEPTKEPTNEPTTAQPTLDPTYEPTNEPTTAQPTYEPTKEPITDKPTLDGITRYEIDYGVVISITFDYNTTNMSDIDSKLRMIITEIIDNQIMMNDITNCVATNNYNISIENTGKSLKIKAEIFVCNDNAQNKLYVTFDEHLETDFIDKLTVIAIVPNGLHVDIDKIGGYITTTLTTEIVIETESTSLVKAKENEENIDVVILIAVILVLLSIIISLILVVIKMRSNKVKDIENAVRDALEMAKIENTENFNSCSERDGGGNTFMIMNEENDDNNNNERDQRINSQKTFIVGSEDGNDTHNIDTDETDSEDINEMYGIEDVDDEKEENITTQYTTDDGNNNDNDDMYNMRINDDVVTQKGPTTTTGST